MWKSGIRTRRSELNTACRSPAAFGTRMRDKGVSKGRDTHASSCNSKLLTSVCVSNVGQAVGGRPTTLRRDQRFEVTGARIAIIPNSAAVFSESTNGRRIPRRRVRIEFRGDHRSSVGAETVEVLQAEVFVQVGTDLGYSGDGWTGFILRTYSFALSRHTKDTTSSQPPPD